MQKIILKLIIISIAVFIIDKLFGYVMQQKITPYTKSGETGGYYNYVVANKETFDFIILGSSRAKHQLDPTQLTALGKKGYNLGINGAGVIYSSLLVQRLITNGVVPKTIVLETDIENYYCFKEDIAHKKELAMLYPQLNKDTALQNYVKLLPWNEQLKPTLNLYKYNGKFFNMLYNYATQNKVQPNNGYGPLNNIMDSIKPTYTYKTPPYSGFSAMKVAALQKINSLCKQHNIRLLIIIPPYYNNRYYKKEEESALWEQCNFLQKEQIISLSTIDKIPTLQYAKYWKDDRHLNEQGAAILSAAVNDYITKNLIRSSTNPF